MSFFSKIFKSNKKQWNFEGINNALSQQNAEKIINILRERNAISPCFRCNCEKITFMHGIFFMPMSDGLFGLQDLYKALENIDTQIPYVGICCQNCGYTWHHSLQILGLTPNDF